MEAGLQQLLADTPAISALIGQRVYPVILPDTPSLPAITYQRISTVRSYSTTGVVTISQIRLQVDSWGLTYAAAKATDHAVRNELEFFRGTLPDGTWIDSLSLDSSLDLYESAGRYYRVSTDYIIFAVE